MAVWKNVERDLSRKMKNDGLGIRGESVLM